MNICADLHTHTLASGHAFSTLEEMVAQAKALGYAGMAITDHANTMPGSPAPFYFHNLVRLPDLLPENFLLIKGIESNVMDNKGTIDVEPSLLGDFDWIIASIHAILQQGLHSQKDVTQAWLAVAENPYVDMIGHPEQEQFRFDYDLVTKRFAANNKVVEINASSSISRPGNEDNQKELARYCKENGVFIAVNSDAHSSYGMDILSDSFAMLREIDFPTERIVNLSKENMLAELKKHNKPIAGRIEHAW